MGCDFAPMSEDLVGVDGARMSVPIASSCYRETDEPLNPPILQERFPKSLICQARILFRLLQMVFGLLWIFIGGAGCWKGGFYRTLCLH